jgi:hypothetical protein
MNTAFERFIQANNALSKCYEATPVDKWRQLSHADQDALCHAEKVAVQGFLSSNQVNFSNIIKERLAATSHK